MVRISGGIHRGRKLRVPPAGVRPTKDMVRLALFSALGESIQDKRLIDLFAGSGVFGLDAISRGAGEVVWVEADARTLQVLKDNVTLLCGADTAATACVHADAIAWLGSRRRPHGFDMVFADPPYQPLDGVPWGERLLAAIAAGDKLKPDGLFVLEQHIDQPVIDNPAWNRLKEARYGETLLVYYRRKVEETAP